MSRSTSLAWLFLVLGPFVYIMADAQDSPIDRALDAARQVDGTQNVSVEILQNDQNGEYDCHGRNARVMGNHNDVLFRNCGTVSIPGNQNTVRVFGAQLIKAYGSSNIIYWRGDKKPEMTVFGSQNEVNQMTEAQPSQQDSGGGAMRSKVGGRTIVIDQSTQDHYEMDCDGRDVKVQAGAISVVLHGDCGTIYVQGADDQVVFDGARQLQVTGIGNTVRWFRRPGTVSNTGPGNSLGPQKQ